MFKALILSLCLLFPVTAKAELWGANQILEATCRVTAGQYYGSGSCIKYENGKYYVLTNAHVVGNNSVVQLEFFKNGKKTKPLPANVVWTKFVEKTSTDYALLSIDARYFGNYPPRVAKLAPIGLEPVGGYVVSAGCPGARWPSAFEGFIIKQESDRILFYPPPLGGQSGSGLYVVAKGENGYETYLKGLITWRIGGGVAGRTTQMGYEENHGGAVIVDSILANLNNQVSEPQALPIPDNYEQVIFDRLKRARFSPSQYNYNRQVPKIVKPQPAKPQVAKIETVPAPKVVDVPMVTVPEPVRDRTKLIPIIPRPDKTPDVSPSPSPDIQPSPGPSPTPGPTDNPYLDGVPDFNVPVEVPPVIKELEEADKKAEEEAKKAEEAKASAEFYENLVKWLGGGGFATAVAMLFRYLYGKGWFDKVLVRKNAATEAILDKVEQKVANKLSPYVGVENAEKARQYADNLDDVVQKRVDALIAKRLGITSTVVSPVMEQVAFIAGEEEENSMTIVQAQRTVLNPVAKAILNEEATLALNEFVNRITTRMFREGE
jgi:hypothetical protein